jgi:hypothetical protein
MQETSYRFYAARAKIERISTFPKPFPNGSVFTVLAEKVYGDYPDRSQGSKELYSVTVNDAGVESDFALITDFIALHTSPTETEMEDLEFVGEAFPIGLAIRPYCFLEL